MGKLNIELNKVNMIPPKEYFPVDVSGTFSYLICDIGRDDEFGAVDGYKTEQLVEGARAEWGFVTFATTGFYVNFQKPLETDIEIGITYSASYYGNPGESDNNVGASGSTTQIFPAGTEKGYMSWPIKGVPVENDSGWFTIDYIKGVVAYGITSGEYSTALGKSNAEGDYSLSVGEITTASGEASVALGVNNTAAGKGSAAIGSNLTTDVASEGQVVVGAYNAVAETAKFVVGTGDSSSSKNGLEVYSDRCNINVPLVANKLEVTGTAGFANNSTNNDTYKCTAGNESIAFGRKNTVSGVASFGFGSTNNVTPNYSGAVGYQNTITHKHGIAIGKGNVVNGNPSQNSVNGQIVMGTNLSANTAVNAQVVIGNNNKNNGATDKKGTSTAAVVIADNNVDVIEVSKSNVNVNASMSIDNSLTIGSTVITEEYLNCLLSMVKEKYGSLGLKYSLNSDGASYHVASIGECTESDVVIASSYNELPVTSINTSAFIYCHSLTSITIPNSVTSIGDNAFYECSRLTSIVIPDSVTSIGSSAFRNCSNLTSIVIPNSVTSISSYAFADCSSLASITIPDSVTRIGNSVFEGCSGLTSITIPFVGNTPDDPDGCFGFIFGATSYPNNGKYVPTSLKTVVITGATSIAARAFYGCNGLTSITILDSVTSISSSAFEDCSSLTAINCCFAEGAVSGAPWGATNATVHYSYLIE